MHLDGARMANACISLNISLSEMAAYFHTITFCLSKGLGAPMGSMLIGSKEDIEYARNLRKMLGGGMR
jgi:threonine aldolase